ncbi:MAG TPA: hypothetical protein VF791_09235 [Pyrinomonadaceae bacterium]
MRSKSGLLVCLAVLSCMTPLSAMSQQKKDVETSAGEDSCLKQTTVKVANRDLIITLHDAEQIKLTVEKYLVKARPKLKPSVPGPGEVFIDCWGTVRMGAWILESSFSDEPELRLTFRLHNSEYLIVRREIRVRQAEGQWKVVGDGRVTYHREPK